MPKSMVTLIRDLKRPRGRERRGLTLAEGVRLVEEAVASGIGLRAAVYSPALETTPRGRALKARLESSTTSLERLSESRLAELAETEQPQGVIAVVEPRRWSLEQIVPRPTEVILVLDAVQDPGNVGTLARTAFALGAAALVALSGTADLANPKVLRASMGGLFRFPAAAASSAEFLDWARARQVDIIVAEAGGWAVRSLHLGEGATAVVVGNEGAGVSPEVRAAAVQRVGIPLRPGAESLNVAVAAGILLYEVTRER